jgi:hypothetical protein
MHPLRPGRFVLNIPILTAVVTGGEASGDLRLQDGDMSAMGDDSFTARQPRIQTILRRFATRGTPAFKVARF